jgi:hypothetical protein
MAALALLVALVALVALAASAAARRLMTAMGLPPTPGPYLAGSRSSGE